VSYRSRSTKRGRISKRYEEYAYVLDYLPRGNPVDRHPRHRGKPLVQLVGEDYFVLLEATPRHGQLMGTGERVYIGPITEMRLKIFRVETEIEYNDLTMNAKQALPLVVEDIIRKRETIFIEFFNIAGPINIRFHVLELLPNIGRKTILKILERREKKPFTSFEELKNIIHADPAKILAERIIEELKGGQRYYLFVPPPSSELTQPVRPIFYDYLTAIYEKLGKSFAEKEEDKDKT